MYFYLYVDISNCNTFYNVGDNILLKYFRYSTIQNMLLSIIYLFIYLFTEHKLVLPLRTHNSSDEHFPTSIKNMY